ncbi:probable multidrug resistance-associated protein lethal(2)03659 [Cylas formicarius]|uniref:probable multidrug resistance-associated protein lethal(2)03659 n=1 Tax=Cylas formicarius TaxID=197179 RepID=UPI00295891F5|nr:probable multidrug resistance-associated protein lethal(2)03659 [Cylas formicarius]
MDHYGETKKKKNPREKANIFSLLTFSYTAGLFKKSTKRDLVEEDIYDVIEPCRSKINGDKFEKKWREEQERKNPSLVHLLWVCFGLRYLFLGVIHLVVKLTHSILEPEAIGKLVSYFNPNQTRITFNDAVYYASIMIGLKLFDTFYFQNYVIFLQQLAIRIRTCFCSLVYRKALRLTPEVMNEIGLGNIITVITKDAMVFEKTVWLLNDAWIDVTKIIVVCYLIYNKVGPAGLVGVAVLFAVVPAQVYVGKLIKDLRLNLSAKTDVRLQATQETLSAIKIIKIYTWEKIFSKRIEEKRAKEMKYLMKAFYYRSINMIIGIFTSKVGLYALIITYIYVTENAQADVIFYIMKNFSDIQRSIIILIPFGLGGGAELLASSSRINKILQCKELAREDHRDYDEPKLKVSNVTVKIGKKEILKNVSTEIKPGLTVVTGPLGCGKSALIKLFLKDYTIDSGKIFRDGIFSYCSQDPWLFPSSIKQNIVFGEPYDEKRYNAIIKVCALEYDLDLFARGDETIVADRGINLSGGQQARINLARAIYKKSDIYLLDDPLHALDPHVQDYIYQNCIKEFLKDHICVLVTHNVKHKNNSDNLILMKEGEIVYDGKSDEVKTELLKEIEEEEEKIEAEHSQTDDEVADEATNLIKRKFTKQKIYSEVKKEGKVDFGVYTKYFSFGGGFIIFSVITILFLVSTGTETYSSRELTNWINLQQDITNLKMNGTFAVKTSTESTKTFSTAKISTETSAYTNAPTLKRSEREVTENNTVLLDNKTVELSLPTYQFASFEGTTISYIQELNSTTKNNTHQDSVMAALEAQAKWSLSIYSSTIFASIIVDLIKQYLIANFARKASVNLHNTMIETLTTAKMSFFDSYFVGNILNRFSQDLNVVDEHLPHTVSGFIMVLLSSTSVVILVASVNVQFLIPAVVLVICMYIFRCIYMPTARSLKRLEAATRSPLIGHLNASIEGVTTIRASKAQKILEEEFDKHQDLYTSAHYMTFCIRSAFGFFMNLLSTLFVAAIVGKLLLFGSGEASGDVGLAITKAATLASLVQWVLSSWTELENDMTSVERVLEYTVVPQDDYYGQKLPNWPSGGAVAYRNVSLAYKDEKVLKDISFEVKSKHKIGIVGRTGAGKSSIISTLFRLYDFEGNVSIDGIDTKTISLDLLRDKISIIPQDPLLFQGTIRENIDPLRRYSDAEVWQTLDQVHMKEHIDTLELAITDHGSNFSTGQRQLICLARAIIKKNKIVVLDEATSNMDPETEFLVQKVVREQFADYTVFIIAHRLRSVLDCNQIIVMEKGRIVEMDEPLRLLNDKRSFFAKMLQADNAHLFDK